LHPRFDIPTPNGAGGILRLAIVCNPLIKGAANRFPLTTRLQGANQIFFPKIEADKWQKIKSEKYPKDEQNAYDLEFAEYIKKQNTL
jgi:hypothetical protein